MTRTTEGADPGCEILTFDNIRIPNPAVIGQTCPLRIQVPKMSEETREQIQKLADQAEKSTSHFIRSMKKFLVPDKD